MTEPKKSGKGRPRGVKGEVRPHFNTAVEYAMHVVNDSKVTACRRDAMAIWLLRTVHLKATAEAPGKKAAANIEAQTAHEDSDWGGLIN